MIIKETIKEVYHHQENLLAGADLGIERELLTNMAFSSNHVLIISGIRRCGKSTLMKQFLHKKISSCSFLNFEDPRLDNFELQDFIKFEQIIEPEKTEVIAFDEIQNVTGWEKYIRSKQDEGKSIILTGSNASLLSKEFGTRLTGRYLRKELFPFSYSEFLQFMKAEPGTESFSDYLDTGGFPEFLKYRDEEILYHILDDIIYRDIAVRYGIRQHHVLRQMAIYLISNSGKKFTLNSLLKILKVGSVRSVADYYSYFEDSYLLFSVPIFSYSLKKQLVNPRKIYSIDTGLAGTNSISLSKDLGRKLENLVFLHLRKSYKNIYYFSDEKECDFVISEKGKVKQVIQVCLSLNPDNLDREANGIISALEAFNLDEGYLVTFSQEDRFERNKKRILVIPAWKWLLNSK